MATKKDAWTRERKERLLLGILDGRMTVAEACTNNGLSRPLVESWVMENMVAGAAPLLYVWTLASETGRKSVEKERAASRGFGAVVNL